MTFDQRPAFARLVATTPGVLIVWFKDVTIGEKMFDLKALQTVVRLSLLADFAHVSIYEAIPKGGG